MAQTGWSQPLDIDIRMYLPEIAGAMLEGYRESGIGKGDWPRSPGRPAPGALRRSLSLPSGNYRARSMKSGDVVTWSTTLPYARIQDEGGRVPARRPRRAKAMHYFAYGREWFMKRVNGFTLPGFRFVSVHGMRAIERRLAKVMQVKWRGKQGAQVG